MNGKIHFFASTTSTNDLAKEMALSGSPHGTIVVADVQSSGRGTKGRRWVSPPGLGLYASFILRRNPGPSVDPGELAGLPFAGGLAAAETIALETGALCRLKWPNDLVWARHKVGGVLVESVFSGSRFEFAVAGIGINLSQEEADFAPEIRDRAASLYMITGRRFSRDKLVASLGDAVLRWYNFLINEGKAEVIKAFESWLAFSRGCQLSIQLREEMISGRFHGLDAEGRLVVRTDSGLETFSFDSVFGLDWETEGVSK